MEDTMHNGDWRCEQCGTELFIGAFPFCRGNPENHGKYLTKSGNGIFPYVTTNVNGKPMQIESLHHLRKIEKQYGVVFSAFSHASSNNVDPVDKNLPKYRGDDAE